MFNGNGGWGGVNEGAVSDEEVEEAQDVEVIQELGAFDDLEPFWAKGDVEEMWNLFNMNEIQEIIGNKNHLALHQMEDHLGLQQIEQKPGLQQIENNGNHLGLPKIVHNVDHFVLPQLENNGGLQPIENNGGLQLMLQNIEEQLNLEDDPGLQQPPHHVYLEWLYVLTTMNHEAGPSGGLQAAHDGGVNVDFNGLGESDEDEHFGEIAELEAEALEDLEPYWVDDVHNGQEQWNLLNMDPPPDEFFDGVDNDIEGMFGGED